ncbi:hypothetical protein SO802_026751, partial [Lithocarpus litseifolius]
MDMLHIPKCIKFVSTVNRPNLFYMIRRCFRLLLCKLLILPLAFDLVKSQIMENDQRMTMLQLIDKMKIKHKELGSELKRGNRTTCHKAYIRSCI